MPEGRFLVVEDERLVRRTVDSAHAPGVACRFRYDRSRIGNAHIAALLLLAAGCFRSSGEPSDVSWDAERAPEAGISPDVGPPPSANDASTKGGLDAGLDAGMETPDATPVEGGAVDSGERWDASAPADATPDPSRSDAGTPFGCIGDRPCAVVQIEAGGSHACAVRRDGRVLCWGDNEHGQLGREGPGTRTPVPVEGLPPVRSLTASYARTCALADGGRVFCWGNNQNGDLGAGSAVPTSDTPLEVEGLSDASQLASGLDATCAIHDGGQLSCWGYLYFGVIGGQQDGSTPVPVRAFSDVTGVAAGDHHVCALRRTGTVHCWGTNRDGQLGLGSGLMASVKPRRVPLEHKIVRIAAGGYTSCGLDVAGDVHCWGRLSTPEGSETGWAPRELPAFGTDVRDLAVAHPAAVCARLESDVMCWGRHRMGVLGVGATHSQHDSPPRRIPLSYEVREVSLGAYFGCARDGAGRVSCWGDNRWGQLGDGTRRSRPWPEPTEILE